jgi:hypothetical protein
VSRSTAEVAETVSTHQQKKTFKSEENNYPHQGLIFSICAATPLQSKAAGIGQQTTKTLLHVQEHLASPGGFPHNFSNAPNLYKLEYYI